MQVPAGFETLVPLAAWALPTPNARTAKRRTSTKADLRQFYDAMQPWIEKILDACDAYPLGSLPDSHKDIFNLALSVAEIAPHVELYKSVPGVPFSFEEARLLAVHGEDETASALPPNRPRYA